MKNVVKMMIKFNCFNFILAIFKNNFFLYKLFQVEEGIEERERGGGRENVIIFIL